MPLMILVVDDNLGTRLSVGDYLELLGYSAITAEDGREALALIETHHPHLIVTDINMPKMDGYELVRKVRNRPEFRLLPVVFLTELGSIEERILGYQSGCDLYLPKPFEMQELGAVVRNLLERAQMTQAEIRFSSAKGSGSAWNPQTPSETNHQQFAKEALLPKVDDKPPQEADYQLFTLDLTNREKEVLALLITGLSNGEIAGELYLSPRTIEKYVSSLLRKTDTSNRSELVRFAFLHLYR
ncbi:MAG: response regulator transcription factor [Coleofasciculaceae cyanobacterium]